VIYKPQEKTALDLYTEKAPKSVNAAAGVNKMVEKKRIVPNKNPMPAQDPVERARNFNEVALGYSEEDAVAEASRCLQCKNEPCSKGCPVEVDIPAFIKLAARRDFKGAIKKLKEKNALPAVCGRVCPQENQCEKYCTLGKKHEPVAIGRIERYCADWELANGVLPQETSPPNGKKVAIVGSGPAGLTCAADLAKMGYRVTVFEALHVAGGVLMYGIPEFRLPKSVVQAEVQNLKKLGVDIQVNAVVGKFATVDELMGEYGFDAVFIGTGAGLPHFMRIPGENACGVYSANEFLTRTNLMKAYLFPDYDTPIRIGRKVAVWAAATWLWTRRALPCGWGRKNPGSSIAVPGTSCPRVTRKWNTRRRRESGSRS
jgi:glutamate synthase (NADPH/NADH) small chain